MLYERWMGGEGGYLYCPDLDKNNTVIWYSSDRQLGIYVVLESRTNDVRWTGGTMILVLASALYKSAWENRDTQRNMTGGCVEWSDDHAERRSRRPLLEATKSVRQSSRQSIPPLSGLSASQSHFLFRSHLNVVGNSRDWKATHNLKRFLFFSNAVRAPSAVTSITLCCFLFSDFFWWRGKIEWWERETVPTHHTHLSLHQQRLHILVHVSRLENPHITSSSSSHHVYSHPEADITATKSNHLAITPFHQ